MDVIAENNSMDYNSIAIFLLDTVPLEEMDEKIANITEKYRFNLITKEDGVKEIVNKHESYLKNYMSSNAMINELFLVCNV